MNPSFCSDKNIFIQCIVVQITITCNPAPSTQRCVSTVEALVWLCALPIVVGFVERETRVMPVPVALVVLTSGYVSTGTFCKAMEFGKISVII